MKKLLITGLLAVSSTGAFIASPVQADDDDRRGPRRDYDRDRDNRDRDNDRWDRDRRPDWNGPRPGNGRPNWNNRPGNGYGRPNWNNNRPGNGYGRPDYNGPRPGYGRPGDGRPDWNGSRPGYGTPPRPGYNGGYYGGGYNNGGYYGGGYGGNYNNRNLENIASRIQSALRNDSQLRRYKLGTDTVGNRIELEGTVRSNNDRQRAINIARNLSGGVQINASRVRVNY